MLNEFLLIQSIRVAAIIYSNCSGDVCVGELFRPVRSVTRLRITETEAEKLNSISEFETFLGNAGKDTKKWRRKANREKCTVIKMQLGIERELCH